MKLFGKIQIAHSHTIFDQLLEYGFGRLFVFLCLRAIYIAKIAGCIASCRIKILAIVP